MIKRSLTGNMRHRIETRLFRKPLLILQMEWKETGRVSHDNCGGRIESIELPDITYWEDARVEDLWTTQEINWRKVEVGG